MVVHHPSLGRSCSATLLIELVAVTLVRMSDSRMFGRDGPLAIRTALNRLVISDAVADALVCGRGVDRKDEGAKSRGVSSLWSSSG
jgi:hypothetical protein